MNATLRSRRMAQGKRTRKAGPVQKLPTNPPPRPQSQPINSIETAFREGQRSGRTPPRRGTT